MMHIKDYLKRHHLISDNKKYLYLFYYNRLPPESVEVEHEPVECQGLVKSLHLLECQVGHQKATEKQLS